MSDVTQTVEFALGQLLDIDECIKIRNNIIYERETCNPLLLQTIKRVKNVYVHETIDASILVIHTKKTTLISKRKKEKNILKIQKKSIRLEDQLFNIQRSSSVQIRTQ